MGISPASAHYCRVEDVAPWVSLLHLQTTVGWRMLHHAHLFCIYISLIDVCVQPHLHVSVRVEGQRSSVSPSATFQPIF